MHILLNNTTRCKKVLRQRYLSLLLATAQLMYIEGQNLDFSF